MGLISIYKAVGRDCDSFEGCGKLDALLQKHGVNFDDVVCIAKGNRLPKDYTVTQEDIILAQRVPHFFFGNNDAAVKNAERVAAREQEKAKKKAQEIIKADSITGSKNKNALGNSIPYIMGTCQVTPYQLTNGRFGISGPRGEQMFWDAILCVGYRDLVVKDVKIGTQNVRRFSDNTPQSGIFTFDTDSMYRDSENNNYIEIAQGKDFITDTFNWAVVSTQSGEEVKRDARDTGQGAGEEINSPVLPIDSFPMRLELCIQFNGLRQFNEAGTGFWQERRVEVVAEWTNNDGKIWHRMEFTQPGKGIKSNSFAYNSNREIRFAAYYDFQYDEVFNPDGTTKSIQVRVSKNTPNSKEFTTNESCYISYMNAYQFDVQKSREAGRLIRAKVLEDEIRDKVTLVAMHLESNSQTKGKLENINMTVSGTARIWDGGKWTEKRYETSNPAAWVLDVMTSERHLLSRFSDAEIDLDNFGDFYQFCEREGFGCDGMVEKSTKKRALIGDIVALADAALVYDGTGLYRIAIDKRERVPVALLNPQDVTDIKVIKGFERKPDGLKISWTDERTWKRETRFVMFDGGTRKSQLQTVQEKNFTYCKSADHAWKMAQRSLRKQRLQPRDVTVDVGREGSYYPLFSIVKLQTEMLKIGIANSVIHSVRVNEKNEVTAIKIGDLVEFMPGNRYGVIIQCQSPDGKELLHAEVTGTGKTRVLEFAIPQKAFVLPQYGNILSFGLLDEDGEFERITSTMKIYEVKPSDNGYTLTLKDYSDAIYDYGDVIPPYTSNLTSEQAGSAAIIPEAKIDIGNTEVISEATTAAIIAARREKAEAVPYAYMESYAYVFYVDSENSPESADIKIPIHVVKGNEELPFLIGPIKQPDGLFIRQYADSKGKGIRISTIPSGETRQVFEKRKDAAGNWEEVPLDTVELNKQISTGLVDIPILYTNNYNKKVLGREYFGFGHTHGRHNLVLGRQTPAVDVKKVVFKFTHSTSKAGGYRGSKRDVDGFLSADKQEQWKNNLHIGDFFMWANVEAAQMEYNGHKVTFRSTFVYRWNGKFWELDNTPASNSVAMNDILEMGRDVLQKGNEGNITNSQTLSFFETLAANTIFCERLSAETAFIKRLFSSQIVINENLNDTEENGNLGYIQSSNFSDGNGDDPQPKGFRIDSRGVAQFYNLIVAGDTILKGETIAAQNNLMVPRKRASEIKQYLKDNPQYLVAFGFDTNEEAMNYGADQLFERTLWEDKYHRLWFCNNRLITAGELKNIFRQSGTNMHIDTRMTASAAEVELNDTIYESLMAEREQLLNELSEMNYTRNNSAIVLAEKRNELAALQEQLKKAEEATKAENATEMDRQEAARLRQAVADKQNEITFVQNINTHINTKNSQITAKQNEIIAKRQQIGEQIAF